MNSITITVSDERLLKLQAIASRLNISIEEVILMSIEDLLAQPETSLEANTSLESEIVDKFYTLAAQWKSEVEGMSSTAQMSQHPAYQEIISMGTKIVPLLLQELKQNPLYWLSALTAITGENPIKPEQRGRVKQMAQAWLEWGKNQGYAV